MTEFEWLNCTNPNLMVQFLRGKISDRKLRLFAVACCRIYGHLLVPEAQAALEVAQKVADGFVGSCERKQAREMAFHVGWVSDPATRHRRGPAKAAVCDALARRAWEAALGVMWRTTHIGALETVHLQSGDYPDNWSNAIEAQSAIVSQSLRCVAGNPFHPTHVDDLWLKWKNGTIVDFAQRIYNDRAFNELSTIANLLEEAGCNNSDILGHCRDQGRHACGCWVVDLLLRQK